MRILVVHPGDGFSTSDVYDGLVWGLRQQPGVTVYEYNLLAELELHEMMHSAFVDYCTRIGQLAPDYDVFLDAARGIALKAIHREITHLIAVSGSKLPWGIPHTLRTRLGIQTAILCTESPYLTLERERHDAAVYDVVFTNDRAAPPLFTRNDPATIHYLPHAYHPGRHTPDGPVGEPTDVRFIGTLFPERAALFEGVDWQGLRWDLRGLDYRGKQPAQSLDDARALMSQIVPNAEAAALYRGSGIVLNHHRTIRHPSTGEHIDAAEAESIGPRAYEIAACRAFQLCDDSRPELHDLFQGSVPTYKAGESADLARQVRHYHALPGVREAHARAAHEAVRPHHWGARAAHILSVLASPRRGAVFPVAHPLPAIPV